MRSYEDINKDLRALIDDKDETISKVCNTCAFLYHQIDDINWLGIYYVGKDKLYLGPFMGKPACANLSFDKGVCAKAYISNKTVVVSDVSKFPGHIACDANSKSEIVVPIFKADKIIALLDIDSESISRFGKTDEQGLKNIVKTIEDTIF